MGKKNRVAVICGWLMFVVLSPGYALGQQQDLISLKVSDVPFVKVLEEIRKQSGYNFMYNEKFTRNVGRITLEVKNLPLETVMEKVLKGTGLNFRIQDNIIILQENRVEQPRFRTLRGTVRDENGEPQLAERFTVVATDLRGYGDSGKPEGLPDHSNYSKRTMAEDQIEVMRALGFERFHVMGHDRGARVAYRMALDHPEAVNKLVLLDIVSTYDMYSLSTREFAKALFQWYFFTQEAPLPEDMILSSRKQFFRYSLHIARYHSENDTSAEAFPQDVYDEYLRHYNVETIHAICEEYRAGETVDLALDEEDLRAGRKIRAETLVLWGANGLVERFFRPLECWAKFGDHIQGHNLPCGHFIPEEAPLPMLEAVENFL